MERSVQEYIASHLTLVLSLAHNTQWLCCGHRHCPLQEGTQNSTTWAGWPLPLGLSLRSQTSSGQVCQLHSLTFPSTGSPKPSHKHWQIGKIFVPVGWQGPFSQRSLATLYGLRDGLSTVPIIGLQANAPVQDFNPWVTPPSQKHFS